MTQPLNGIGLHYLPSQHKDIYSPLIDFIEITPEYFVQPNGGLRHLDAIHEISKATPTTLHGVALSMCSAMELPNPFLDGVANLKKSLGTDCFSEHLSFTRNQERESDLYIPPAYNEESLEQAVEKVNEVCSLTGSNFHLENVASMMINPFDTWGEGQFFEKLCRKSSCGLMLNLDSAIISSKIHKTTLDKLIMSFPLEHVTSIILVPRLSMNIGLQHFFGDDVDREMLNLLELLLRRTPARSIVVQRRYHDTTLEVLLPFINNVRDILRRSA
ncbi:MAG: multinuclear nonheme iron-dependent oxidase [Bdellovibrionales bacterium]